MCSNKSNSCPLKKLGHDWTGFQSQHLISYVGLIVSSKIFLVKNSENITYKMQKKKSQWNFQSEILWSTSDSKI